MGLFAAGQVVSMPFPYSDLTDRKTRPVLLLAPAGYGDWVGCQITSNPFSDPLAVPLAHTSFTRGGLRHVSYARPSKLFTASETIVVSTLGELHQHVLEQVRDNVVRVIRSK
jgi:mRNA interferase MazF